MAFLCPTCGAKAKCVHIVTTPEIVRRRHRCPASPEHDFATVQFAVGLGRHVPPDAMAAYQTPAPNIKLAQRRSPKTRPPAAPTSQPTSEQPHADP